MRDSEKIDVPIYKLNSEGATSVTDFVLKLDVDSCLQQTPTFQLYDDNISVDSELSKDPPKEIGK